MTENGMTGGGGKNLGSIAERRAAKCGFKPTPRLSTARFRSSGVSPLSSPAAVVIRSPFVTIPPGISPTTLLDSPVMLFHSQALPSPTTGSFQIPFLEYGTMLHAVENANAGKDNPFMFRNQPIAPSISSLQNADINQVFPPLNHEQKQQIGSGDCGSICKEECPAKEMQQQHGAVSTASLHSKSKQTHRPDEYSNGEDDIILQQQLFEEDELARFTSSVGRQSEDPYNWQKHGRQKQVESGEFPLSYSMGGKITDIICEFTHHHRHPKPPPHPPTPGSAFFYSDSIGEFSDSTAGVGVGPPVSFDEESTGKNFDQGGAGDEINAGLKAEGLDWASSASVVTTELSDAPPPSTARETFSNILTEYGAVIDGDAAAADGEDDDDDDKSESKRRKRESSLIDSSPAASSSVREPRVVVQTISDIDILEDGYRWRKYGQKVVKGNPNPRSYYKCTHPGCSVRKLVERASYDLKSVITTYEGKHNHAVPAGKSQKPPPAAAAAAQPDRGPDLFGGCHEIYELLSCRARKKAASFHPQNGGFTALNFGSLSSGAPFPVSNLDQSFLGVDDGFAKYGHYYQPRASAGEAVEFLHGQHKSTEEDDMIFATLPREEQGNVDPNTG